MEEIRDYLLEGLENLKGTNPECADLHHEVFNRDYYIIGTERARRWVEKIGAFDVIGEVVDYESFHFGEVYTDCADPEKVATMYVYIRGGELLDDSKTYNKLYDEQLNDGDLQTIINELN